MTARIAVAVVSLVLAGASAGCIKFYEIAVETPIQAKIDVTGFQRVLVAGFLAGGSEKIDPNTETARLLRSQLRSKSDMRVVDADVIPLVEEVNQRARRSRARRDRTGDSGTDPRRTGSEGLRSHLL